MKIKYYLRGLGMGILFATLVMTVSSVIHNNNLSEEKIIKEAKKLGMIMPEEETESKGLFASKSDIETESTESIETEVESTESVETEVESTESIETEAESTESIETEPESIEPESGNQIENDSEEVEMTATEPVSSDSAEVGDITYIQIQIVSGSAARQVAQTLYENGLIENAEEFRIYMGTAGYAAKIRPGEYLIPVGATYEEICKIVTKRAN